MQARAWPPYWRIASALLIVLGRGSMLVLLVLLLFFETRLTNPLRLIRLFTVFCLVPELAAWLIGRAFAVELRTSEGALVLEQPRRRIEVPFDSIERVEPWTIPLPAAGLWLRLRSGGRFYYGLGMSDPSVVIDAVSIARGDDSSRSTSRESAAAMLRLAAGGSGRRWYHVVLKFPIFALVPALPLFRLHQWITYGGTFGEYHQYGLEAYVLAFLIYWANATIWLVLYAAGLRAIVALGVMGIAVAAPSRAASAARAGEAVHRLLYFGGVVVFLARLYMLSRV